MYTLVIGNRNYSSWSLRAWLYMTSSNLQFDVVRLSLFSDTWIADIAAWTDAGRVPVLAHDETRVWDSLAIIEHLRECEPNALDWPRDPAARANARSIVAELHSGFLAIRNELPQNLRLNSTIDPKTLSSDCTRQLERLTQLWTSSRTRFGGNGPWLFGEFSIADVFYAPVALRLLTYNLSLGELPDAYSRAVAGHPAVKQWVSEAKQETESLEFIDQLMPVSASPLTPG